MANEFYRVEVLETQGTRASVRVTIRDAEQRLPVTPSWALMMLNEATWTGIDEEPKGARALRKASPLAKATARAKVEALCRTSAGDYVRSVTLGKTRNYPVEDPRAYNEKNRGDDARRSAWGLYEIEATDARWLEHLRPGLI